MDVMRHNRTVLASLKEGDLVEFPRGIYSHWAVYIGNEDVVHLSGYRNDGVNGETAVVRKDNFFEVAGVNKANRNNSLDERKQPLSRREIVKNALCKLGERGYNLVNNNCEHFATWCRYGEARSQQVDFWVTAAATFIDVCVEAAEKSEKSKKQSRRHDPCC